MLKLQRRAMMQFISLSMCLYGSYDVFGQPGRSDMEYGIGKGPYTLRLTQGLQPLQPKPGYVIGRILDTQGRPMTNVVLYVAGSVFGGGDPSQEVGGLVNPQINPQTGYYEIKLPDGIYRVTARFDESTTAQFGLTISNRPTAKCQTRSITQTDGL